MHTPRGFGLVTIVVAIALIAVATGWYLVNTLSTSAPVAGAPSATTTAAATRSNEAPAPGPSQSAQNPNQLWYKQWQVGEKIGDFTIASMQGGAYGGDSGPLYGNVQYTGTTIVRGRYYVLDGLLAGAHFDVDSEDGSKLPHIIPGDDGSSFMFSNGDATEAALGTEAKDVTIQIANYEEHFKSGLGANNTADFVSVVR